MMPRHINPTSPDRTATAPYNFVPLPNRVFTVEDGIEVGGQKIKPWQQHDRFILGTYSGWIDLEIEVLTPIYIRGAVTHKEDGTWDGRKARVRPEPYMLPDGRPAIPGSSLRGMVRTLVEILAFAKIQPVCRTKFSYRRGKRRLPYDLSPFDLVPEEIRNAPLDLAEVMFGKVDEDEKRAIKGRVFFEDAVAVKDGQELLEGKIVPKILSSPKPTSYQNYLTQDGTKDRNHLTSYFREDSTTIRGHKLYWHRWCEEKGLLEVKEEKYKEKNHDEILKDLLSENPQDKQHTVIQPVKGGSHFRGRIRFENLTDLELGALLAALELPEHCAHKLGMGKPLGLGSVRIKPRLRLIDRMKRYQSWSATGDHEEDGHRFREVFEKAILDHARKSNETFISGREGLGSIARLDALYRILQWKNRPALSKTAYMELERFKQRPVLPTPHKVLGMPEPAWPEDPPKAGEIKNSEFSRKNKKY